MNIIGFTTECCCKFFFKPKCQSLVSFTSINTWHRLRYSLLFRNQFWQKQSIILLSRWLVLKILVTSTWFIVWLVNCIRFSWTILGFFILTKLLSYSFISKILLLVLFLQNKNILISDNLYRENSSLLREICVLFVNLSEISCANYLLLLFTMKFFGIFSESIFHKKIFFFLRSGERKSGDI